MGIVTNIVLALVLVCRVHLLGGVPGGPSPRTLKVLRWAVGCQLFITTLVTIFSSKPVRNQISRRLTSVFHPRYCLQYDLAKNFVTSDEQGRKSLQGRALEAATLFAGSVLALIGCLHVAISIYLCYAFLRPLWRADRQLGGGDPALRAQTRRVLIATFVAVAGRVALNFYAIEADTTSRRWRRAPEVRVPRRSPRRWCATLTLP